MENTEGCGRHGRAGERAGAEKGRSGREMQNMTDKSGIQRKQTWKILGNGGTGAKKENNKYILVDIFLPNPLYFFSRYYIITGKWCRNP